MSDTPTNTPPDGPGDNIQPIQLQDEMERSFIDYAMSVIMSRALPDVRDGLKPVHRRIIWDMDQQGFRPNRAHVKSARVTGDTMAKYHPHGNSAIYDALVRMAQPFSLRHPLIDFHGNYGSPDFGPAASRYTESRLHPLAMQLLADIDEDTVDLIPTYDGTAEEPTVLPSRFPNLLVNGASSLNLAFFTELPKPVGESGGGMRDSGRGTPRISAGVAARGNVDAVVASPGPPGQFSDMATPGYPRRVAIVGGVRTPFAKAGTVLKDISAIELGKIAVRELLHRTGVEPADVNLLAFGTVIPSVIAPNIAREVAKSMHNSLTLTSEATMGTNETAATIKELAARARQLKASVSRFKV